MKKILILFLPLLMLIILPASVIVIAFADGAEEKQSNLPLNDNLQCKYNAEEIVFDGRTEAIRAQMRVKVSDYYMNVALAMYQNDPQLTVDEIAQEIKTWDVQTDIGVNLQDFKYKHKYIDWLFLSGEKHSLALSKKYYMSLNPKPSDERAYMYYLDVLSLIDPICEPIHVTGDWVPPLEQPYVITQEYGVDHIYGDLHLGIDMSKGYGERILAVADGEIIDAQNTCMPNDGYLGNTCNQGMGNYVKEKVVMDGREIYILYMHMQVANVNAGDVVVAGQPIGKQGNSGNSTGSHLHLEFRRIEELGTSIDETYNPHEFIDFN